MRAKSGTHSWCLFASCRRKSSGSISIERSPRRIPNRKKRLKVRPASDPLTELCNLAMPISILRRLESLGNRGVARPGPGCQGVNPLDGGRYPERVKKRAVLLDAAQLFRKLHFLYGYDATIHSPPSSACFRP